jgi:hypothetical protein
VQSVVSGVMGVMMVIDLHKGVWWEEEQERKREAGEGYDGCVTAWVLKQSSGESTTKPTEMEDRVANTPRRTCIGFRWPTFRYLPT